MMWFRLPLFAATLIAVTSHEIGLHKGRQSHEENRGSP